MKVLKSLCMISILFASHCNNDNMKILFDETSLPARTNNLVLITVLPQDKSIAKGDSLQYSAIGTFSDGSTIDITHLAEWTSDDPGIATFSGIPGDEGHATGISSGTTTIHATLDNITGNTLLTIKDIIPLILESIDVISSDMNETQLILTFSEEVDAATANIPAHYACDMMGYGTHVTSAARQNDFSQVLVTLAPGLARGMHEGWVINVQTLEGITIENNGIDNNVPFFVAVPTQFADGPVFVDPFFDGTKSALFVEYDSRLYLGTNDAASKLFEMDKSLISIQNIHLDADGTPGAPIEDFNGYLSYYSGCSSPPCDGPINGVDNLYAGCVGGTSTPDMTGAECTSAGGVETFFISAFNTIGKYHSYWRTNDVSSSTTTFTFTEEVDPSPSAPWSYRSFNNYLFKEQLWNNYGAENGGGGRGGRVCMKTGGCNDGTTYLTGPQLSFEYATRIGTKQDVYLRNGSRPNNTFGGQVSAQTYVLNGINTMHEYDKDGTGPDESQLYVANGGFYEGPLGARRVGSSDGGIIRSKLTYSSKNSLPQVCQADNSGCINYWEDVTPDNNSDWNKYMSIMLPQNSTVTGEGNCSTSTIEMDCAEPYNVFTPSLKAIPSMRTASNGDLYLIRNACSVNTVCLNGKADCDFRTVKQTCPPGSEVPQLWMMQKNCGDAAACASQWKLVAQFGSSGKSNMQGKTGDCGISPNKCGSNRQITLLETVGSYLYIGFDNHAYGVNIWRADMSAIPSGSTPAEADFELVNNFGLDATASNKKLFSYISYNDSIVDWLVVATGNGKDPVVVYRTSNEGN